MKRLYLLMLLLNAAGITTVAAQTPAPVPARVDSMRVGDVLKLWIWREEEMTGEFPIPESGMIVFPKIGPRNVLGVSTAELRNQLIAEYQKYLRNPAIEITFLRRVNVLGAVNEPGVFSLDETMTIAHALALAGGARPDGRADRVELFRDGEKLIGNISQRTKVGELHIRSGDQLFVPERSWMARNTGLVAALLSSVVSVTIAIIASN
jgi:polysaccharide export outer membrane protein